MLETERLMTLHFPVDSEGHIVALEYLPKKKRIAYENKVREWCREHPNRADWPKWLQEWPETKKRLE